MARSETCGQHIFALAVCCHCLQLHICKVSSHTRIGFTFYEPNSTLPWLQEHVIRCTPLPESPKRLRCITNKAPHIFDIISPNSFWYTVVLALLSATRQLAPVGDCRLSARSKSRLQISTDITRTAQPWLATPSRHPARETVRGPFNCHDVPFSVELQRQTYTGNFESTDGGKAAASLTVMLSCSLWHSNGKASASNHNSTDGESAVAPLTALLSCFPWSSKGKASARKYNATDGERAVIPLTAMLSSSARYYNATDGERAVVPLTAILSCPPWNSTGEISSSTGAGAEVSVGMPALFSGSLFCPPAPPTGSSLPPTTLSSFFPQARTQYLRDYPGQEKACALRHLQLLSVTPSKAEATQAKPLPTLHVQFSSPITQGSSPTMPGPASVRRKYEELHPRDRNVKQNRRRRIEKNWGCELQDAIPMRIRPRVELKKGAKIRIGDINGDEEIWWNWSVEVLRSLEELSTMMAGRLTVARELMILEVQKRQEDGKNPQRKVAEILLGDLQRVVDNVKRQQAAEYAKMGAKQQLDIDMESFQQLPVEDSHGTWKEEQGQGQGQSQGQDYGRSPELDEDGPFPNIPSPTPDSAHMGKGASQHNKLPNMSRHKLSGDPADQPLVRGQLKINDLNASLGLLDVSEMRIRAKRLRTVAMRLEAEAFEMEADLAMARQALNEERDF
ncbi:hypothetical protein D6C91_02769 [Aureobasidium pullulans]|uniref:Uncharacterized protein n=1 Tax=Aureobasidium pullulans TaxID=5580 RepID=A0A4S9TLU6_AURPU|nr:hypothetical protein D6C91_02769 [Aureobasidium pullulans]